MAIPNLISGYDLAVGKEGGKEKLVHALVGTCGGLVDLIDSPPEEIGWSLFCVTDAMIPVELNGVE
jgi:hypothetical protein